MPCLNARSVIVLLLIAVTLPGCSGGGGATSSRGSDAETPSGTRRGTFTLFIDATRKRASKIPDGTDRVIVTGTDANGEAVGPYVLQLPSSSVEGTAPPGEVHFVASAVDSDNVELHKTTTRALIAPEPQTTTVELVFPRPKIVVDPPLTSQVTTGDTLPAFRAIIPRGDGEPNPHATNTLVLSLRDGAGSVELQRAVASAGVASFDSRTISAFPGSYSLVVHEEFDLADNVEPFVLAFTVLESPAAPPPFENTASEIVLDAPSGGAPNPTSIDVGDLGNGRAGIVVSDANTADMGLHLLFNIGPFTFSRDPRVLPFSNHAGRVRLTNIDSRIARDQLVLDEGTGQFFYHGAITIKNVVMANPAPTLSDMAVADFNGDGQLDAALTDRGNARLLVALGPFNVLSGTTENLPAYTEVALPGTAPGTLAVADLNGDGQQDVVVLDTSTSTLLFVINLDGSTFELKDSLVVGAVAGGGPVNGNGRSVETGDVNADGRMDLLVAEGAATASGRVQIFYGNGQSSPPYYGSTATLDAGSEIEHAVFADLNGDSKLDVIAADTGIKAVLVWLTGGSGEVDADFTAVQSIPTGSLGSPREVRAGDFNQDAKLDIVVRLITGISPLTSNETGFLGIFPHR